MSLLKVENQTVAFTVDDDANADVDGNLNVDGTLTVDGATTLTGATTVTGALTANGGIVGDLKAKSAVILKDSLGKILLATGTTVPSDAATLYAKGCLFIDTDVATGTSGLYVNVGTSASCVFKLVTNA